MMQDPDIRPGSVKFAMWLIKTEFGLKLVSRARKRAAGKTLAGVLNETVQVPRTDGSGTIRTRIYKPFDADGPLPIVVFFHGGGYATGWPERHHAFFSRLMLTKRCIVVAPGLRLSIEAPYPAGHDEAFDVLKWAAENAETIGGRKDWVGVAGNSSGGGFALSCALRARDAGGPDLAFMMPMYPMIDDRTNRWSKVPKHKVTWSKSHGVLAWHLLLKSIRQEKRYDIPPYAAPARADDLSGLPQAIIYVGKDDILHAEVTEFSDRLASAGNKVAFREFEGLFHAMEDSVPGAQVSGEVHKWFAAEFSSLMDTTRAVPLAENIN